jgi:hypothetical protein
MRGDTGGYRGNTRAVTKVPPPNYHDGSFFFGERQTLSNVRFMGVSASGRKEAQTIAIDSMLKSAAPTALGGIPKS